MGLIKHILFHNFWSFLLVISGLVDISLGLLFLAGTLAVKGSVVTVFVICISTGLAYLLLGLALAWLRLRKEHK